MKKEKKKLELSKQAINYFSSKGKEGGNKVLRELGVEHFQKIGKISAEKRRKQATEKLSTDTVDNNPLVGI